MPIEPEMPQDSQKSYDEALRRIKAAKWYPGGTLELSYLGLTKLPPEIGELTQLEGLSLRENRLKALPPEIGGLSALKDLSLYGNRLKSLPTEIGQLSSLVTLSLRENQLTNLPPEIGRLSLLESLYLSGNELKTLPREIGKLTALKLLLLEENELNSLPIEMCQLRALQYLTLHGNPELAIPESVLGARMQYATGHGGARPGDILTYYFDTRAAAGAGTLRPLHEIKVMLVGDGGAGKTSLRRFFMSEPHEEKESETMGIALTDFPLRCGSENITVHLWDFAGQDITHALHQFFLTEGCVYVVVVEPRSNNEQADAEKWLKLIERYGEGAPAIVVMNKQDTRWPNGYDLDRNWLREHYPFVRAFVRTSCGAKRDGCEELLAKLREVVVSMSEAKQEVPESWLQVKNECFARRGDGSQRHYLSLKEFRDLCARHGENDSSKQESLARILHDLGAVLHFVDEPRLRDTTVLNPHWVTDGAYRLLRCKDGPGSDSILTLEEAINAVPSADESGVLYLLELMERFEMCFPVEGSEETPGEIKTAQKWLVPGALDKNQPDRVQAADWRDPAAVRLRYTYDPLPEGVLPRFIVMTHLLSEGLPRWRNGVIIADGEARALVRKGARENTVEVTVVGRQTDAGNLVKVVRGYLTRIHADLPEPRPEEFQALAGTEDYRDVLQMRLDETMATPINVKTAKGIEKKNPTDELNRTSAKRPRIGKKQPLRVFLSYSQEDKREHSLFRKNLMALESDNYIRFWDDPSIKAGMDWRSEIDRELETMDIFIGLLTTNFVASQFIQRVEFRRALERRRAGSCALWLVLVDDRRLAGTAYEKFQVIRPARKPVRKHSSLRAGFDLVEKEIHKMIVKLWDAQPDWEEISSLEG